MRKYIVIIFGYTLSFVIVIVVFAKTAAVGIHEYKHQY